MDALARRRALSAAAKVALSFSFLTACGGTTEDRTASDDTNAGGGTTEADDALRGRVRHPHNRCDSGTADSGGSNTGPTDAGTSACALPQADAGASASTVACCVDLVNSHVSSDDAGWITLDPEAVKDPDVSGCCRAIGNGYWTRGDWNNDKESAAFNACCSANTIPGPTCTPWGPPMPPRMRPRAPLSLALEVA